MLAHRTKQIKQTYNLLVFKLFQQAVTSKLNYSTSRRDNGNRIETTNLFVWIIGVYSICRNIWSLYYSIKYMICSTGSSISINICSYSNIVPFHRQFSDNSPCCCYIIYTRVALSPNVPALLIPNCVHCYTLFCRLYSYCLINYRFQINKWNRVGNLCAHSLYLLLKKRVRSQWGLTVDM